MRAAYGIADNNDKSIMHIPPPSPNRLVDRWNTWNSLAGDFNSRIVTRHPKQKERRLITVNILFEALLEGKIGNMNITRADNSRHKLDAWLNAHVIFSSLVAKLSSFGEGAIHISMQRTADTVDVTKRRT